MPWIKTNNLTGPPGPPGPAGPPGPPQGFTVSTDPPSGALADGHIWYQVE